MGQGHPGVPERADDRASQKVPNKRGGQQQQDRASPEGVGPHDRLNPILKREVITLMAVADASLTGGAVLSRWLRRPAQRGLLAGAGSGEVQHDTDCRHAERNRRDRQQPRRSRPIR
jgi:hypothetical protein